MHTKLRHLVVVLGDQLKEGATARLGLDPAQDALWMAKAVQKPTQVRSAKQGTTVSLRAMRHRAQRMHQRGLPLLYCKLDDITLEVIALVNRCFPHRLLRQTPSPLNRKDTLL